MYAVNHADIETRAHIITQRHAYRYIFESNVKPFLERELQTDRRRGGINKDHS